MTTTSMNTTTTTTARRTTTTADRLLAVAKGSRFEGAIYTTAAGAPLAATDGSLLVVLGQTSAETAGTAMIGAVGGEGLPPTATIRSLITSAVRDVIAVAARGREGVDVSLDTAPDAGLAARAEAERAERVARLEADLATRERHLEAVLASKRRDGSVTTARERVTEARAELRAARTRGTQPAEHALLAGEGGYDLRLVRKALRALGAKRGSLATAGEYDPAILYAEGGIALIMPFRK